MSQELSDFSEYLGSQHMKLRHLVKSSETATQKPILQSHQYAL